MATINQLIKQGRESGVVKSTVPLLDGCPQKRGVCLSVTTTSPKNLIPHFVRLRESDVPTVKKVLATSRAKVTTFRNTVSSLSAAAESETCRVFVITSSEAYLIRQALQTENKLAASTAQNVPRPNNDI